MQRQQIIVSAYDGFRPSLHSKLQKLVVVRVAAGLNFSYWFDHLYAFDERFKKAVDRR